MKKTNIIIWITFIFFLFTQFYLKNNLIFSSPKEYEKMLVAATKMDTITKEIKKEKLNLGFSIDTNLDKNNTGLIGEDYTEITTTLGSIEAKRTSINPDFAALFVRLFTKLGLKKGDYVAANLSSSFPGLNLSFISALDIMELNGIIISSIGSSSYGGNIKDFNYLDMEYYLSSKGYINNKSIGYSLGGADDIGREFPEGVKEEIILRNKNRKIEFFYNENLDNNIDERYSYYKNQGDIKAFVNIGGNILATKGSPDIDNRKVIIKKTPQIKGGLIGKFLDDNIPVLYMLGLKEISLYYGIPYDSTFNTNTIGKSSLYHEQSNMINYLVIIVFILFAIYLKGVKYKNNKLRENKN